MHVNNIVSESLSQVNPQSSVEIKCILEGSTAVVNGLDIRLSRLEGAIDDRGITQETDPDISANRREVTYRVISVSEDDQFFCILSRSGDPFTAISVTGFVYNCIRLNSAGQCSPNECSCTKETCTSQTGRCEATCSVFQCPANIASVSLSQVNPQSSVEISCILEGSTAVVNRLDIRLSRLEEAIDDRGITQETDPDISADRREETYRVISVSEDDKFFCVLSLGASIFGSINVTGFVYKLPSISDQPTEVTRTTTSVTITWRPWTDKTDVGDPPVVAYTPYYKMNPSQDWMSGSRIQADQTLEYTASSLESDRNYTFSVAAVREREGGEGPRGPPVTIKTLCIICPGNLLTLCTLSDRSNPVSDLLLMRPLTFQSGLWRDQGGGGYNPPPAELAEKKNLTLTKTVDASRRGRDPPRTVGRGSASVTR
ncbi:putative receptor-type tyrosine-protein phosphatase mu-like [Apostichopus japonicus]|uniref:Putative receptor-type tyrosine-protein phosphatase mu-like n=1 Tax=Stichopus japonicus TaxID=307972 RepID=A0A2G8LRV1_STIJA|nr:putative receptor-type tyrosine-protein phosphatase mu-like [Apostichopus japonicus]